MNIFAGLVRDEPEVVPRAPAVVRNKRAPGTLTKRQAEIVAFMRWHLSEFDRLPTRQGLCDHFGWVSNNAAEEHIQALCRHGVLEILGTWYRFKRDKNSEASA